MPSNLKFLFKYLKPYKLQLILVFIALCFSSSSVLALGIGIRYLIDYGLQDISLLNKAILYIFSIITILVISSFTRSYFINVTCEKIMLDLRNKIYSHLINMSVAFHEREKIVFASIINDTELISNIIVNILSFSLRNILMSIGGIIMMYYANVKLAFMVSICVFIIVIPVIYLAKGIKEIAKKNRASTSALLEIIEESFSNIKTLQAYDLTSYFEDKFFKQNSQNLESIIKRIKLRSTLICSIIFLTSFAVLSIIWYGVQDLINNKISAGNLTSFIFYSFLVATSIGGVTEVFTEIIRIFGIVENIEKLLEVKDILPYEGNKQISNYKIKFENVNFAYPTNPGRIILENFNLEIEEGEFIGIVGPSGTGKSSLMQLLLRFYDINSGNIFIGNHDIKEYERENLTKIFTIIGADYNLFAGSILYNIQLGDLKIDRNKAVEILSKVSMGEFLESHDLDYYIDKRGSNLSAGQKQRILLARALVRESKILLLDEATNAIDTENENKFNNYLKSYIGKKTILLISHNISNVSNADKIIVINEGKIISIGKHEDLIKECEIYKSLSQGKNER